MTSNKLTARNLSRYGMRRGAYDGANRRRFVLFTNDGASVWRREFDTKRERDAAALAAITPKHAHPV